MKSKDNVMSEKHQMLLSASILVVAVGMQAFARTIVVLPQPVSPYADTEASRV